MERQGRERNHRRNSNGKGKKGREERGEVKIVRVLAGRSCSELPASHYSVPISPANSALM